LSSGPGSGGEESITSPGLSGDFTGVLDFAELIPALELLSEIPEHPHIKIKNHINSNIKTILCFP